MKKIKILKQEKVTLAGKESEASRMNGMSSQTLVVCLKALIATAVLRMFSDTFLDKSCFVTTSAIKKLTLNKTSMYHFALKVELDAPMVFLKLYNELKKA